MADTGEGDHHLEENLPRTFRQDHQHKLMTNHSIASRTSTITRSARKLKIGRFGFAAFAPYNKRTGWKKSWTCCTITVQDIYFIF